MSDYISYDKPNLTATISGFEDTPADFYNYDRERNELKAIVVSTPKRVSLKATNTLNTLPISSFRLQLLPSSSRKPPTCAILAPPNARRKCAVQNSLAKLRIVADIHIALLKGDTLKNVQ